MSILMDIVRGNASGASAKIPAKVQHGSTASDAASSAASDAVAIAPSAKLQVIIQAWKKPGGDRYTSLLLKRLQPTIRAAMTSYAGGISDKLRVPAANLALHAAKGYDGSKGAGASTYIFHALKRLNRVSAQRSSILHIPENTRLLYGTVHAKQLQLQQQLGRQPTVQQLADATRLSRKRIQAVLGNAATTSQSSTENLYQNKDVSTATAESQKDYMDYVYASSDPINKKIIQWSTGLYGKPILSSSQIAEKLKMTAPAVSQRRKKIQEQLSSVRGTL